MQDTLIIFKDLSFLQLKYYVEHNIDREANKVFAERIVANDLKAVNYFLTDFSASILEYVSIRIMNLSYGGKHSSPYDEIFGDYYSFISAPIEKQRPVWHKIQLYKGSNEASLKTYVSRITCRYFSKLKKKQDIEKNNQTDLLDYFDYETLLKCEAPEEDADLSQDPRFQLMMKAFSELSEKDRKTLQYLVMYKTNYLDAFEDLSSYINPKKGKKDMETWNNEQKQNAMSLLKGRALGHLIKRMENLKDKENEKRRNIR